jgi:hypothetical protein
VCVRVDSKWSLLGKAKPNYLVKPGYEKIPAGGTIPSEVAQLTKLQHL